MQEAPGIRKLRCRAVVRDVSTLGLSLFSLPPSTLFWPCFERRDTSCLGGAGHQLRRRCRSRWAGASAACCRATCSGRVRWQWSRCPRPARSTPPASTVASCTACSAGAALRVTPVENGVGYYPSKSRSVRRQRAPRRAVPPVPQARPCVSHPKKMGLATVRKVAQCAASEHRSELYCLFCRRAPACHTRSEWGWLLSKKLRSAPPASIAVSCAACSAGAALCATPQKRGLNVILLQATCGKGELRHTCSISSLISTLCT